MWRDLLIDVRYPVMFVMGLLDALIVLASYSFLAAVFGAERPGGFEPLPFLLIGIALTDSLSAGLVCLALGVRSSQQPGIVKALHGLPIGPVRLMLLSMGYPTVRATLDFAVFLVVAVLLGVRIADANVVAMLVVFALALGSIVVLGLISASFTVVFKRGDPVLWAVATATWLLSGVLYPTDVLPASLRLLSSLLPTTHALSAMRGAVIHGASLTSMAADVGALLAFDVVGIPMGLWLVTLAVTHAKRAGTLGHA